MPTAFGPDYLKLFQQKRLQPDVPEHRELILRYLAYYEGQKEYGSFWNHYAPLVGLIKKKIETTSVSVEPEEELAPKEEPEEVNVEEEAPKVPTKKTRASKKS